MDQWTFCMPTKPTSDPECCQSHDLHLALCTTAQNPSKDLLKRLNELSDPYQSNTSEGSVLTASWGVRKPRQNPINVREHEPHPVNEQPSNKAQRICYVRLNVNSQPFNVRLFYSLKTSTFTTNSLSMGTRTLPFLKPTDEGRKTECKKLSNRMQGATLSKIII